MAVWKFHSQFLDDVKAKGLLPAVLFKTNEAVERVTAGLDMGIMSKHYGSGPISLRHKADWHGCGLFGKWLAWPDPASAPPSFNGGQRYPCLNLGGEIHS